MLTLGVFVSGLVVGFVTGVLVFRKNKQHMEQLVQQVKDELNKIKK